ncbi:MAG: NAD(P)H-dependent oxidoreductase, partial [Clostridia bacterium]|nr:NAD(P)H-dependent oxidoreductase [Clostridia bacterium]
MKNALYVIRPSMVSELLLEMIQAASNDSQVTTITEMDPLPDLANKQLLFAMDLNEAGFCIPIIEIISQIYKRGYDALAGSKAGILIYSPNDYNTKSTASDIIFQLNLLGCLFPGHPVVEAVAGLNNFKTWQKTLSLTLKEICLQQCSKLGNHLAEFHTPQVKTPYIVALHSSSDNTSNTLALWNMVKSELANCEIEVLHVENGTVM